MSPISCTWRSRSARCPIARNARQYFADGEDAVGARQPREQQPVELLRQRVRPPSPCATVAITRSGSMRTISGTTRARSASRCAKSPAVEVGLEERDGVGVARLRGEIGVGRRAAAATASCRADPAPATAPGRAAGRRAAACTRASSWSSASCAGCARAGGIVAAMVKGSAPAPARDAFPPRRSLADAPTRRTRPIRLFSLNARARLTRPERASGARVAGRITAARPSDPSCDDLAPHLPRRRTRRRRRADRRLAGWRRDGTRPPCSDAGAAAAGARSTLPRRRSSPPSCRSCSTARCPNRRPSAAGRHRRDARQRRHAPSRACRRRRSRSWRELVRAAGLRPRAHRCWRASRPPWSDAGAAEVAAFLERWRAVGFTLLRSAYDALHQIIFAAWYGNPRSWPAIGYPGPPGSRDDSDGTTSGMPRPGARRRRSPAGRSSTPRASSATSTLEADVVIVGTGAGGGIAAEMLAPPGSTVDPGRGRRRSGRRATSACANPRPTRSSTRSRRRARPGTRRSTSCRGAASAAARPSTGRARSAPRRRRSRHWAAALGLAGFGVADLAPWFERMEARLSIAPWDSAAQRQQRRARPRRATAIGIAAGSIRRNVKGCWNLGYCGDGLPDQRQAVDAGDDDSRGAGRGRDAASPARARSSSRWSATASWR